MGEMRVMGSRAMLERVISDETKEQFDIDIVGGDTRVIWNPRDRDEVEGAKSQFDHLVAQRFLAFKVDEDGAKGDQITEFDSEVGKMILAPPMAGGAL